MDRISLSSWSLHRALGPAWHYLPGQSETPEAEYPWGEGRMSLLDAPAELAAHGIFQFEICSFHLPSLSQTYLDELKAALRDAGVKLQTLLIEAGDPSHPETGARDVAFMHEWAERADALGAANARVIAGKQAPGPETLAAAAKNLNWLCDQAEGLNVRLVTENWYDLLSGPEQVHQLLDQLGGRMGLNGDLGNWKGAGKYDALGQIMGRAELCHCKAHFEQGVLDDADYGRCIRVSEAAGYKGPYTLIFDNDLPADEWDGIEIEKRFVTGLLAELGQTELAM